MWKHIFLTLPCLMFGAYVSPFGCPAQEVGGSRALFVNRVRNNHPAFMVRVAVDRADRTYRESDSVKFTVRSERDGFLYLLNCRVDGTVFCLFPNKFQPDNAITAGKDIHVPAAEATFSIDVGAPFSNDKLEIVKAIVTREPLQSLKVEELIKDFGVEVPESTYKALYPRDLKDRLPASWGEHHVEIRTVAAKYKLKEDGPRRIAVVVGIRDYSDPKIRDLRVCAQDATQFGDVLRKSCGFDEVTILTDEQATLANVERAIRKELADKSRPGDTVVIYWSGHGGRCADDNGDEKDGYDEFLVVHDGQYTDIDSIRKTMLLDDTLGRWIQELDGRQVALVLDTCHSGGQATGAKAVGDWNSFAKGLEGTFPDNAGFDFLDGEIARTKDIGQQDTAVLASSTAKQISFERREGDLSVMTYFVIELLKKAEGKVSLQDAHRYAEKHVPAYVEKNFPGTTQLPILVPRTEHELSLRP